MAEPDKAQLEVATSALRKEAGVWDSQGAVMQKIAEQATTLDMGRIEAGIFQVIVGTYQDVVRQITDRATEGSGRMKEVADALVAAANVYDQEEAGNLHRLKHLY